MTSHYERLSALDASFLLLEKPNVYTHVASTLIFEGASLRTDIGGIDFESIRKAHSALLDRFPRYRQVLRFTPLTGQPIWVDDPAFDLDYHVRHAALPRPGTREQLRRVAAQIMQQHLDRARPLWETWVIEGLEGDRFALVTKIHHCMIDGIAGVDLMQLLLTPAPRDHVDAAPAPPPAPQPRAWELLRDDLWHRARMPVAALRELPLGVRQALARRGDLERRLRDLGELVGSALRPAPVTPLNRGIGPRRRFDGFTLELERVRRVRRALGGTLNDVVLAVAAGAFRSLLLRSGVDPGDLAFRALVPVSVRRPEDRGKPGNQTSAWILPLPVGEEDPVERLRRLSARTAELAAARHATGAELLTRVAEWVPATLLSLAARVAAPALPFETIVTNVPGPQAQMYLLGARLLEVWPHVPLVDRVGLALALLSYAGRLFFEANADPGLVPELSDFVGELRASFAALEDAAGAAEAGGRDAPAPGAAPREAQSRHRALTERTRRRHDALTAVVERLEAALASPAPKRRRAWGRRVARELAQVRDALRAHAEASDEPDGLLEELSAAAPRLEPRIAALREEHPELERRAQLLAERVEAGAEVDFEAVRGEASDLLTRLRRHRSLEADLIFEAFWTDIGAGD